MMNNVKYLKNEEKKKKTEKNQKYRVEKRI